MSFQAYLDTIRAKTGLGPDDFKALAEARGLAGPTTKATEVYAWLAQEFGLGRGHAMLIQSLIKSGDTPKLSDAQRIDKVFEGGRAAWRPTFEALYVQAGGFGGDVGLSPTDTYVSFVRGGRKFAIAQPGASFMDMGIKLKGAAPTARFAEAGAWNTMVTHRVRLSAEAEADAELIDWMRRAYEAAKR